MKARGVAVTSNVMAIPKDRHADHRLVFVAAPLQVPGSTGSIVNPLAMF